MDRKEPLMHWMPAQAEIKQHKHRALCLVAPFITLFFEGVQHEMQQQQWETGNTPGIQDGVLAVNGGNLLSCCKISKA